MFRILLADDNVKIRTLTKALIETRKDFTVCGEASDGVEAVSKAVNLKPDLVIVDFAMGLLNGLQVGAQLSKTLPDLPIILHSVYGFTAMVSEAKKAGIREVVTKAESGDALLDAIDRCLNKSERPGTLLLDIESTDGEQPKEPPKVD
jgi:DNA-binding NarL/FixJ family response regulator